MKFAHVVFGGTNMLDELVRAVQQKLPWAFCALAAVIAFAAYRLRVRRKGRKCREKITGKSMESGGAVCNGCVMGNVMQDFSVPTEELGEGNGEIHTLVDIGYCSSTEVIE